MVTQNDLRDYTQVVKMIAFAKAGGKFTRDARLAQSLLMDTGRGTPPPIHIAVMEDGLMLLHDGHHRTVSLFLAGRTVLDESEYELGHYTYNDYLLPNPDKGWFTPFDPRTECRLPDFHRFKRIVVNHGKNYPSLFEDIKEWHHLYAEPRQIHTVKQLSERYTNG